MNASNKGGAATSREVVMISKQMDRPEVAVAVGVEKKNVGPVIKEMKAAGRPAG